MSNIWALGLPSPDIVFRQLGLKEGVSEGMEVAARRLQARWVVLVSGPGTQTPAYTDELRTVNNRVVPVASRAPHQAGEKWRFPARDTGDLAKSIKIREATANIAPTQMKTGVFVAGSPGGSPLSQVAEKQDHWQVYSDDIAARIMEWGLSSGTPGAAGPHPAGIVIMPRPALRVALADVLPQIRADVLGAIRTNRGRGGRKVSLINLVRRGIIQFSTVVGNLGALGISIPGLSKLRGGLLRFGTGLGDLNALAKGTIDQRIARRVVGAGERRIINRMTSGFGSVGGRIARKATVGPANRLLSAIRIPNRI